MEVIKWLKANFIPFHLFLGVTFVSSGLIVCFLMLLTFLLVWPFSKSLYRKIIVYLAYAHWSQFTFLGQWWSGSDCTLLLEDPTILKYIGNEHTIVIMNHKYDIDWLMSWILSERFKMLGGTKIYGKSSLRLVPLLGWAWFFAESIFLKRNWEKDRQIIARDLNYIKDFPDKYWFTLLLFCEGTRFTESKHKLSMEFAAKHNLPILKHHLSPRTKGFTLSMYGLKEKVPAVLDLTIAFAKDSASPTLMSILQGKSCRAYMYARRIPLCDIPTDNEEACAAWLQNHYKQKDDLYEEFVKHGCFKKGTEIVTYRRPNDLIMWSFWALTTGLPISYYVTYLLVTGSLLLQFCALVFFIGGIFFESGFRILFCFSSF
ncbi:hypothetical protein HELRODRAFT_66433 [Helobdella robusta]|uniref:Phospholipid/glycerol acyltransferase domain-containing protein n=1 Tax=Helobdella robusta TaxID=6412 RepID=T1FYL2_HELRO|nr:hypothetical protein HELRODRAFT_66433 [Helobdella robusta]ESO02459.1 hypothetical protein HELRODRAFT_66433 [Helobdella robusta]